jgi:hypothetical protein
MPESILPEAEHRCTECGGPVAGGRAGCQALWDEMMARSVTDLRYRGAYRLAFDTYCMQHVDTYGVSAKSYAAHLMGLCCGIEHGGDAAVYDVIHRSLNGSPALERPASPVARGSITLIAVAAAPDPGQHAQRVQQWAQDVWDAYAPQHGLARSLLAAALGGRLRG